MFIVQVLIRKYPLFCILCLYFKNRFWYSGQWAQHLLINWPLVEHFIHPCSKMSLLWALSSCELAAAQVPRLRQFQYTWLLRMVSWHCCHADLRIRCPLPIACSFISWRLSTTEVITTNSCKFKCSALKVPALCRSFVTYVYLPAWLTLMQTV